MEAAILNYELLLWRCEIVSSSGKSVQPLRYILLLPLANGNSGTDFDYIYCEIVYRFLVHYDLFFVCVCLVYLVLRTHWRIPFLRYYRVQVANKLSNFMGS
jgi:hypothetical protein